MPYRGSFQQQYNILGDRPSSAGRTTTTYNQPSYGVRQGLQGLVGQYNVAYGQAREANEARYQQLLDITSQSTGQRQADIRASYAGQSADIQQQLSRQGMAGTTVAPTMQMGVQREQQSALNRLADQMQGTKLGIIERRQDRYPDLGSLQSIIAGVGSQYGGGQGLQAMLQAFGQIRQ